MRRLSAILMIAALFAALVPSATLAGPPEKPIDEITSITWVALGDNLDTCTTDFTVSYTVAKGPPRHLRVVLWNPSTQNVYWDKDYKAEGDGEMTFRLAAGYAFSPLQATVSMSTTKVENVVPPDGTSSITFSDPCDPGQLYP